MAIQILTRKDLLLVDFDGTTLNSNTSPLTLLSFCRHLMPHKIMYRSKQTTNISSSGIYKVGKSVAMRRSAWNLNKNRNHWKKPSIVGSQLKTSYFRYIQMVLQEMESFGVTEARLSAPYVRAD